MKLARETANEDPAGEQRFRLAGRWRNLSQLPWRRSGGTRALGDDVDAGACADERARFPMRQILRGGPGGIPQHVRSSIKVACYRFQLARVEPCCAPMGRVEAGCHSRQQAEPGGWPRSAACGAGQWTPLGLHHPSHPDCPVSARAGRAAEGSGCVVGIAEVRGRLCRRAGYPS